MAAITQPITVTVFSHTNRQAGTYTSTTAAVPEGVYAVGIADTMTDAEAGNTASSFTLTIQVSPDGVAWQGVHQEQWVGGTHFSHILNATVPNHIRMQWSDTLLASGAWTNWQARAVLVQNVQMRVGLDLTVYPPGFGD